MHAAFKEACDILLENYSGQPSPQDVMDRMINAGNKISEKITFLSSAPLSPPAYQNNFFGQLVPLNFLNKTMKYTNPSNNSPLKSFFDRMQQASPNLSREAGLANFYDMWIAFFATFLNVDSYSATNAVQGREELLEHIPCFAPSSPISEIRQVFSRYTSAHEMCVAKCIDRIVEIVSIDEVRIHELDEEGDRQNRFVLIGEFASENRRNAYETLFKSVYRFLFGADKKLKTINKYTPGPSEQVSGVPSPPIPVLPSYLDISPV